MIHTFKKDADGWAIILFPFDRASRAMVSGADTFLDILSQREDTVILNLSTEYQNEGWEKLEKVKTRGLLSGADYIIRNYKGIPYNHEMWLCALVLAVFKHYPETIFFQVL